MNRHLRESLVLLAVVVLPWIGILQALPHSHADLLIPREELDCSASSPTSHEVHLHHGGRVLTPHQCLACLAGSSFAVVPTPVMLAAAPFVAPLTAEGPADVRWRVRYSLPLVRGPPVAA